jgi:glycine cleavage system aminomethyltransferase T
MESAATPHKSELRKTPLNAVHRRLGAKMVNFGGWDMPVEYPFRQPSFSAVNFPSKRTVFASEAESKMLV